ncbi:MAG TPA: carboxymuconolactone decarboxylase family protein [Usitatibacter sp.]|jgi:alkylhydroperoxidase/carboxymuconolactone decarboxylase family protein YurZ|nr:carboxymuconolactone decarboxylase family protein [Usitatibacter sp.]
MQTRTVETGMGNDFPFIPGFLPALERSPEAQEARMRLDRTIRNGTLGTRARAMIALAVAHQSGFDYCIWAQSNIARGVGLTGEEMMLASVGTALDRREGAIVRLAREIARSGTFSEQEVRKLPQDPILTRAEMLEVVANVAAAVIDNYIIQSVAPDNARATHARRV